MRLFVDAVKNIVVSDPGDKEAEPRLFRLLYRDANARGAVVGGYHASDLCLYLDGNSIRAVGSDVKAITLRNRLVEGGYRTLKRYSEETIIRETVGLYEVVRG